MRFDGVTKVRGRGGGVTPVKLLAISTAHCGLLLVVASAQLHRGFFPLFRRKSFARSRSMTGPRDTFYQRNFRKSYSLGVTTDTTPAIRSKLMKSEAIGEEDTTADSAVCEH